MKFTWLKPSVPRDWLVMSAGCLWSIVGISLMIRAGVWLISPDQPHPVLLWAGGAGLALLAYRYMFTRIVAKNIQRVFQLPENVCFFAFQAWKSYLNVAVMISLGIFLRHSAIPRSYLAVSYTAIGGALFLASLGYYRCFISN